MIHVIAFLSKDIICKRRNTFTIFPQLNNMNLETSTGWFQNWFCDIIESSWPYHRIDTKFIISQTYFYDVPF